eukprot:TRINITY_DN19984_c0_g1_i2.p2 TRINITY_DN19984_c0_g1~~TRINITY_DN19984_c0_g1_i2.p2  ORF type:complete len:110 (+),score=20.06 TRINITY_DN19984_c0_g1_i2:70-399(+)
MLHQLALALLGIIGMFLQAFAEQTHEVAEVGASGMETETKPHDFGVSEPASLLRRERRGEFWPVPANETIDCASLTKATECPSTTDSTACERTFVEYNGINYQVCKQLR